MNKVGNITIKKLLNETELFDSRLELDISGNNINHIIINTLRRITMSEIPIYVFNKINIIDNTSIFNNNYIKLRIKNIPVMGICGGEQLINVVLGGTLVQDINSLQINNIE